ncbi:hypothetical protein [Zobellia russellii]|uniref:hypothetical protein n=1 Tax=Zobellia russellii TaxID=248907 RepID=UPI001BFF7743|nr:hypothetical protein [Zobellia russellii]MBT9187586.1 hypothetical protein [Zobellia russellii]
MKNKKTVGKPVLILCEYFVYRINLTINLPTTFFNSFIKTPKRYNSNEENLLEDYGVEITL